MVCPLVQQDDIVSKTIGAAIGGRRAVILSDDEECVLPSLVHLAAGLSLVCFLSQLCAGLGLRRSAADDDDDDGWSDDD